MKLKKIKIGKHFFEFASVFFAVIAAFALNNWNDNRRDAKAEEKILIEIKNGLQLDLADLQSNRQTHIDAIYACAYFEKVFEGNTVPQDSIQKHYFLFTSNNTSNMNTSGYESLKSRGLELIKNDSIRLQIIELYDGDYQDLKKFEEETPMTQFFANYFKPINNILSPYLNYDETGMINGLEQPIKLSEKEKKLMFSYNWQIRLARYGILSFYEETEVKINKLLASIEKELEINE